MSDGSSINPFTASFANPWPIVPDYPPSPFASPLLIKYLCSPLAFHAGATTPSSIGKEPVYPWISRPVEPVKRNAAGVPQYQQQTMGCYGVMPPNESVTPAPLSPQPTPPTSLSPGNECVLLSCLFG